MNLLYGMGKQNANVSEPSESWRDFGSAGSSSLILDALHDPVRRDYDFRRLRQYFRKRIYCSPQGNDIMGASYREEFRMTNRSRLFAMSQATGEKYAREKHT